HRVRADKETELEDEEISDDERAWEIFKKDDVLHLPGAHDPELWRIETYKSARSILNLFLPKSGSADQMKVHVGFTAVVFRPEVDVSTIFIETTNVLALAAKLQNVVIKKRTLVPLEEHPDILKLLLPDPIPPHQSGFWVRIGAGTYRDDLGWCIDDTWERRKNRHVWVVPRMRGTGPDESNAKGRPEQRLVLTPGPGHRGRVLKCGLLDVGGRWDKLHMPFRDVNPSENEVAFFRQADHPFVHGGTDKVPTSMGDRVFVIHGQYAGRTGFIREMMIHESNGTLSRWASVQETYHAAAKVVKKKLRGKAKAKAEAAQMPKPEYHTYRLARCASTSSMSRGR
ncbi:hypothetical protein DFH09DRAFT_1353116, partial [Mycena vulgaris]